MLGVPIDQITMPALISRIHQAASKREPLFLSTPNLNFLMLSQREPAFRRALLESDLCPADGMGVILICRLLGVPITARVAGSDLPAALQASRGLGREGPLRLTLLGGEPGVAEAARVVADDGKDGVLQLSAAADALATAEAQMKEGAYGTAFELAERAWRQAYVVTVSLRAAKMYGVRVSP